jgi:HAE1 family hydrophobic/amphiphilic exporter-1
MFSKFFIEHPIFANVIAIVTMLLGAVMLDRLPIAQYPEIAPPTVEVSTSYPGANASIVAETVGQPIEEEVNGVENMLYMSSKSTSDGNYALTVTFEVGTDLDISTVLVQNRVNTALAKLPQEVQRQGVTVAKKSTSILMVVAVSSPSGAYDDIFLSNFATLRMKDELARLPGVGDVTVFGASDYSMRIWLDPNRLKARGLSTTDVLDAVAEQNQQVAAGRLGAPPQPADQNFQYTINALGRLSDVEQFENIIVKSGWEKAGQVTRIRDVARVELGAQNYELYAQKDSNPAALVLIYQLPGANALATAKAVREAMERIDADFPEGVAWDIPYDTTLFVEAATEQVYHTLIEAAVLVLIVILVFLQDWRAMLVPATTVPVTILGAFIAMAALGFSINLMTLFAIVLSIGIVVDDAIIVVEGAAHHMEEGMTPHDATIKAMSELLGPIIGITLVLTAVFLPAAMLPGITGQMYRQFALVIASTALISAINAMTLKPAQTALWMRPSTGKKNAFYRGFNRVYDAFERFYTGVVAFMVKHAALMMVVFAGLFAFTVWWYTKLPTGFLPTEDKGYGVIVVQLPDSASQARTREVTDEINRILAEEPGVAHWVTLGGMSILDGGVNLSNAATVFATWEDWGERGDLTQEKILASLQQKFARIQDAIVLAFPPPVIDGLGSTGGFEFVVQDRGDLGLALLQQVTRELVQAGNSQSALQGLGSTFSANAPQLFVDVDREKAKILGIPLDRLFNTLQTYLGSAYVNDFNKFGRTYQVNLQADARYRLEVGDIRQLDVRDDKGQMIPLGTLITVEERLGTPVVTRYNLYPSSSIFGNPAPGTSSGQALKLMEQMAGQMLPSGMGWAWTGTAYQEKKVGNQAIFVFALAIILVFLVLAAQYESWTAPAAVILVVPLALLGTVAALALRGYDNNVYTQIGVVLLIALAAKNAILIVEFGRELRLKRGLPLLEAAVEASRLRLRAILMTSFAFTLGVVPLLTASGAGAASQRAVGTAVFGGMLASTFLAILFVPAFFVVMQRISERREKKQPSPVRAESPRPAE